MKKRYFQAILATALLHLFSLIGRYGAESLGPEALPLANFCGGMTLALKPLPVLIGAVALWTTLGPERAKGDRRSLFVAAGLILSGLGDAFIEVEGKVLGLASGFLLGMGAFALAHVAYLVSFDHPNRRLRPIALLLLAGWTALTCKLVWNSEAFQAMHVPLVVYTIIITTMMWRAVDRDLDRNPLTRWAALPGALLFGGSDTLIAIRKSEMLPDGLLLDLVVVGGYWLSQIFIGASAFPAKVRDHKVAPLPEVPKVWGVAADVGQQLDR